MKQQTLPRPGSLGAWALAIRPKTLSAGGMPVVVGSSYALAAHAFSWPRALGALVVGIGIQIGTNLVNDVADHLKGADTHERLGPPRVTNLGLLSSRAVVAGAMVSFVVAAAAGVWLASVSGWVVLIPGALAVLCGVLYTVGPVSIAYLGLGEIFVLGFFGVFATAGTTFVMVERWVGDSIVAGVAMGLLAVGILEANNIRDIPTDAPAGKKTLAVRLGDRASRWLYAAVIVGAFVAGAIALGEPRAGFVLVVLAGPLAISPVRAVLAGAKGRELIPVLQSNSLLEMLFGLVFAVIVAVWKP